MLTLVIHIAFENKLSPQSVKLMQMCGFSQFSCLYITCVSYHNCLYIYCYFSVDFSDLMWYIQQLIYIVWQ